jgi:chromosome partitioning protein
VPESIDPAELVGLTEVSEMAGVTRQAVGNWRFRDDAFPAALAELQSGPVFSRSAIRKYLSSRRKRPMAHVISFINLKGGVGKTTTAVAVAELLAGEHSKRVLLIDLDPQTNATVMLIGDEAWGELNDQGRTLKTLFADALEDDESKRVFNLEATRQRGVSPVREVRHLDLLPSSLAMIDVQDRLASVPIGRYYSTIPTALLQRATKSIIDEYDYVLIDCPPNLGIITLNGLRMSDGYVIPTIPDVLSTYGIPQILTRVKGFADEIGETIEPYGIIISKYRAVSLHNRTVERLQHNESMPRVFGSVIPETVTIAQGAEYGELGTLRQRWGYGGQFEAYARLTEELMAVVK